MLASRRMCRAVAAVVAAVSLAALAVSCTGRSDQNSRAASYESMPRLTLQPGTAFCAQRDAPGCEFVDIMFAARGSDGRVALAGMGSRIAEFDSTGSFVRYIGARGRGPGEYRALAGLRYGARDHVAAYDFGNRRIVRFDRDGHGLPSEPAAFPPGVQGMGFAGDRIVFFTLPGAPTIGDTVTASFLGVDSTGAATVPLGAAPAHAIATGDGTLTPIPPPFRPNPRWAAGGDGSLYFVEGDRLRVLRADGSPHVVVDLAVEPPAVTEADLDSVRAERLDRPLGPGAGRMPPAMQAQFRRDLEASIAKAGHTFPMIADIVALDDGTLWTRETKLVAPDSARWNGFTRDGQPLGYILLPVRANILAGDRSRLLVVMHDADDVPTARWYALP